MTSTDKSEPTIESVPGKPRRIVGIPNSDGSCFSDGSGHSQSVDELAPPPSAGVIPLRHPPDVGGSFTDGVAAAIVAHSR